MRLKKSLFLLLLLLVVLNTFIPFVGYTSERRFHSVTIKNNTTDKKMRENYFYMYFPNYLSGEFICPKGSDRLDKHYFNQFKDAVFCNYPIELHYEFTCGKLGSGDIHDFDTTLKFVLYDKTGKSIGVLGDTVRNKNGGKRTGSVTIPPNHAVRLEYFTGKWYFKVGFIERLRAYKGTVKITYRIDEDAPPTPTGIRVDNAVWVPGKDGCYTNGNPVIVRWDKVTDRGNPVSGVEYYTFKCGSVSKKLKTNYFADTGNTLFAKDGHYSVQIAVSDFVGNKSDDASLTFIVDRTPPTGSISINSAQGYANQPMVILKLQANDGNGSGVKEMRLKHEGENYGPWEGYVSTKEWVLSEGDGLKKVYVQYRDYVGNVSEEYSTEIVLDTTPPYGTVDIAFDETRMKVVAGKKYVNDAGNIVLNLSAGDGLSGVRYMQFSNDGTNYSLPIDFNEKANWTLSEGDGLKEVYVRFIDGAGNYSDKYGTLIKDMIILDTTGPTGKVLINDGEGYTNDPKVTLQLETDDGNGIGGTQVCLCNEGEAFTEWEDFMPVKTWTLKDDGQDGLKTVYVLYKDVLGNVTNNALSASIYLDRTAPTGSFNITSRDGKQVFDLEKPTNTPLVAINNLKLTDTGSGVKGVYLWNGDLQVIPPDDAVYYDNAQLPSGQGIDWELLSEAGQQKVSMLVLDRAGNSFGYTYSLYLDTTPPPAPELQTFRHTPNQFAAHDEQSMLNFFWEAKDEQGLIDCFMGRCIINGEEVMFAPGQIETTVLGDRITGRVTLDVRGLAHNQPVTIKIRSLSKAGNESKEITYTAWTKASLGEISYLGGGYDELAESHYLSWQLTEPGIAAGHCLEFGEMQNGVFVAKEEIRLDTAGVFVVDGLSRRQTGYFRLVALNGSNDRTEGPVFTATVPNVAPTAPQVVSPIVYARNEVEFQFGEVHDFDGDHISYEVYFAEGEAPSENQFVKVGTLTQDDLVAGVTLKKTGLVHNQTYTWYVVADDGYEGGRTISEKAVFTVDIIAPVINIEQLESPYTNKQVLSLWVTDDLSGIGQLMYKRLDGLNNNQIIDDGVIPLTLDPNGNCHGTINLTEGQYHLHFTVFDQAGNQTSKNLNNLLVDHTPPQLSNVQLELDEKNGQYIGNSHLIPIQLTAVDNLASIKGLHYRFITGVNQEESRGFLPLSSDLHEYRQFLVFKGVDGQEYYLETWVEDKVGNSSECRLLGPIFIDRTPPYLSVEIDGLSFYGGQFFLKDLQTLTVTEIAEDAESLVGEIKYALVLTDNNKIMGNWTDWTTLQKTPLVTGERYRLAARVENWVGLSTVVYSQEFIFDNTPPEISQVRGAESPLTGGEQGVFTIWAEDAESGITKYRLALGTSPCSTEVSAQIVGNQDGWLISDTQQTPGIFRFETPEIADGVYYASVVVENAVGAETDKTISFVVDNSIEKLVVNDQGPYTFLTDRLFGTWRYLGARTVAEYRYRIVDQDNNAVTDWQKTVKNEENCIGLSLQPGNTYRFEVQAIFAEGDLSPSSFSGGITVDNTPPERVEIVVPAFTTSDRLWLEWSGVDLESNIAQVQVAVGTDYMKTDVTKGWVSISGQQAIISVDTEGMRLDLPNNTKCYLSLRLTNGAGLTTEVAARPVIIDDTPPPVPVVYDQGAFINDKQPLEANWIWSEEDPESGTVQYQWAIMEFGQVIHEANWQEGEDTKKVILSDFPQEHGKTYCFAVKATNGAGLSSIGLSDGITVDKTVPFLPKIKLVDAINLGDPTADEVNYISSTENLGLWIESYDPESNIASYYYTWGVREEVDTKERMESLEEHILLANPDIKEGEITIFAGESLNNAGEYSPTGYSTGVLLDNGAPKVENVRGFYSGNKLYFDWDVIPSNSPVVKYEISLVSQGETVLNWQEIGDERSVVLSTDNLEDGYYRLLVRAYNAAGGVSRREHDLDEWGESPIIALDRTPPTLIAFEHDKYVSQQITSKILGVDNLSGIKCYQYAVGTATSPFQYTGSWQEIAADKDDYVEIFVDTEDITHNTGLYLMVRVCDKAGLWSEPYLSEVILVDHTPPENPEISCGDFVNSPNRISDIEFTGYDPESGITHYMLGVVSEEQGEEYRTEPIPISEFTGELTVLNLLEGKEYQLFIRIRNGAGVWSEFGFSNTFKVDSIPPVLKFTGEETGLVLNQPPLDVEFHLSEEAEVEFTLVLPDGTFEKDQGKQWLEAGEHNYSFSKSMPGTYRLLASLVDRAGNRGEDQTITIRVNAPPEITLPAEIRTTPGQPVRIRPKGLVGDDETEPVLGLIFEYLVFDSDGEIANYLWEPWTGAEPLSGPVFEYSYMEVGNYALVLTVEDNDGASVSKTVSVIVDNTTSGRLYKDETWSGEHLITGDVFVPEGITLSILPGTIVIVDGIPGVTGYNHGIIVEGQLLIEGEGPQVSFSSVLANPGSWKGITLMGRAEISNFRIEHAVRGLAIIDTAQVTIDHGYLAYNEAGIHVYGCRPHIQSTVFDNNTLYGIKEDGNGRPIVTGCQFINNGIDYYHEELTALSMEQLNNIEGNSGNW